MASSSSSNGTSSSSSTTSRTTRGARKRGLEQQATANAPKRAKSIKWEWLGDGAKWNQYNDQNNEELIKAFAGGNSECTFDVAPGVKMKARFDPMTQTNMSTGWQRDIRCISSDPSYTTPIWEMEKDEEWTNFPEIASRQLEAAHLCGVENLEVSIALKSCKVDLHSNEMTNEAGQSLAKIRRRSLTQSNVIWEWKDEHGNWNSYNTDHCELIEDGYSRGHDNISFTILGRNYQLDLTKMVQTNLSTKVDREIRRRDVKNGAGQEVGSSKPKKRSRTDTDSKPPANKVIKNEKTQSVHSDEKTDQSDSAPASNVKSQVFSGKCPVDTECTSKLGKAQVFCEGSIVWNCTLNQTNIKNNNNKFYIIQLLEDIGRKSYSVWFRWGRVGKKGQCQLQSFGSNLDSAKSTFTRKFHDKTNNAWDGTGKNFVKVHGKYDFVEVDYEAKEDVDAGDDEEMSDTPPAKPESKLKPQLQSLIELICNVQAMEDAVKEMKYDTKKAPLGKLTSSQIKQGYAALKRIESLISSNNPDRNKLIQACDEFYTRIPHDFGMRTPPVMKTKEEVKQKLTLLETLGDIQIALKVIQEGNKSKITEHPVDRHYKELHCQLEPLDKQGDTVKMIEKYIKQTHGKTHTDYTLSVTDVFEMDREGEEEGFRDVGNRQLLWHGSRLTNWVGIINQGLRIAPPEAPVTGYMFGKGVYFADISSKSANYCFASPSKNEGLLILCEVALGKPNELLAADYNASNLPAGTHSVKALGRISPNPTHSHTLDNGCVVPLGPTHDTGVRNPKGYTLNYNEYIVYDTSQIKMKYLVRLKFNFK